MSIISNDISAKFFPEIAGIGESPNFVDFTPEEIASDGFMKVGLKSFEIDANIVDGALTNTEGKVDLMAEIHVQATAYIDTLLQGVEFQYVVNVYVLSSIRQTQDIETVTETGNYVDKVDVFLVETRIEVRVGNAYSLLPVVIQATDGTNTLYNLTVVVENDIGGLVEKLTVDFDQYTGTEPEPDDSFILSPPVIDGETRTFTIQMTFADPPAAIGEDYDLIIGLLGVGDVPVDIGNGAITFAQTVTAVVA